MKFFTTAKISDNIRETPEGYLVCVGVPIARTGDMTYGEEELPGLEGENGQIIVTRSPDQVFKPETMASFEGKAVTILHPNEFVGPDNWSTLAKGILTNIRRGKGENENDMLSDLLITDMAAIELVKGGLREVSCGYDAEYVQTGAGRAMQQNIIGNHLALVSEGRAGAAYAINDHNGKGIDMTVSERIKKVFSKAQDEALKIATEDVNTETPEVVKGFVSIDAFEKGMKSVGDKLDAMMAGMKPKGDASTEPEQGAPAKVDAKDEESEKSFDERLTKLEDAIGKMLEGRKTGDDDEESEDAYCDEESEEVDDEAGVEAKVGDSAHDDDLAARVEILAPGMNAAVANVKAKALTAAFATKDGKAVIEQFVGKGVRPNLKDSKMVESLFIGASELLKVKRSADFAKTRTADSYLRENLSAPKGVPTPEEVNKQNEEHYTKRAVH